MSLIKKLKLVIQKKFKRYFGFAHIYIQKNVYLLFCVMQNFKNISQTFYLSSIYSAHVCFILYPKYYI